MLMVLVSLLTTLILGLVLLILVHYAIVSWEQDRVNNLSKQIRSEPTEDNILSRPTSSHKFTNVDLKTSLRWSGEV
jgi:heme/copper-type cytochrome/quinol oxidase subunit 1